MRICDTRRARRQLLRVSIAAGALVVPAAAATAASAATLAVGAPCYVNATPAKGAPIDITGSGYTPGDTIAVQGQAVFGTTTSAPDGSINLVTSGPILPFSGPGTGSTTLTSQDETSGAGNLAQTSVTMANFSVATQPSVAKPSRRVTWRFSGFIPGHLIYVHYLHKGKVVTRMTFGKAQRPCGTLKARDRFYPGGHPHYSTYGVVFDQVKRYTKRARPRLSNTLSFF
ncbi:MAG: hypothetical protein ABI355_07835 [Solirubrobacteraceae bacterium]